MSIKSKSFEDNVWEFYTRCGKVLEAINEILTMDDYTYYINDYIDEVYSYFYRGKSVSYDYIAHITKLKCYVWELNHTPINNDDIIADYRHKVETYSLFARINKRELKMKFKIT